MSWECRHSTWDADSNEQVASLKGVSGRECQNRVMKSIQAGQPGETPMTTVSQLCHYLGARHSQGRAERGIVGSQRGGQCGCRKGNRTGGVRGGKGLK